MGREVGDEVRGLRSAASMKSGRLRRRELAICSYSVILANAGTHPKIEKNKQTRWAPACREGDGYFLGRGPFLSAMPSCLPLGSLLLLILAADRRPRASAPLAPS
jgi:hypothetical protein